MSVEERLRQWQPTVDGVSVFTGSGMAVGAPSSPSQVPKGSTALSGGGGASALGTQRGGSAGAGGRCLADPRAIADRERKTAHLLAIARQAIFFAGNLISPADESKS